MLVIFMWARAGSVGKVNRLSCGMDDRMDHDRRFADLVENQVRVRPSYDATDARLVRLSPDMRVGPNQFEHIMNSLTNFPSAGRRPALQIVQNLGEVAARP